MASPGDERYACQFEANPAYWRALSTRVLMTCLRAVLVTAVFVASVASAQRGTNARLVREAVIDDKALPDGFTAFGVVAVGPGKRVYVGQPRDNVIRVFDSTGKFVRSIGAKGDGPGETQTLGGHGFIGDTLWTHDWQAQRFAFFQPDGSYMSTLSPQGMIDSSIKGRPIRILASNPLIDGSLYYGMFTFSSRGDVMPPLANRIVTRDGRAVRVVGHTDSLGRGHFRIVAGDRQVSSSDPFFGQMTATNPIVAVGGGGRWFAVVRRDECATTQRFTVARTSLAGDTLWRTQIDCPKVAVPRGFVDSVVAANRDRMMTRNMPATASEIEQQIRPKFSGISSFTPVLQVEIGADESIWLRPMKSLGDSLQTWVRADAKPNQPAQFTLPPRAQLKAVIDATHVWVQQLNEDDLPSLVRYRLTAG